MHRICILAVAVALLLFLVSCQWLAPQEPDVTFPTLVTTEDITEGTTEGTTPAQTTPEETTPEATTPAVTEPDFSNPPDPDGTKRY